MAALGTSPGLEASPPAIPETLLSGNSRYGERSELDALKTDYSINRIFLHFGARQVERRFAVENLDRALPTIRLFLVAASILYACGRSSGIWSARKAGWGISSSPFHAAMRRL